MQYLVTLFLMFSFSLTSCTDKAKVPLGKQKQALSSPSQKSALSDNATKKVLAWRQKSQNTKRRQLRLKQRAWQRQKWKTHRVRREALRLRMLEKAQSYQRQLVKVKKYRTQRK